MPRTVIHERLLQRRQELVARTRNIGSDLRDGGPAEGGFVDQAAVHANDAVLDAIRESATEELRHIDTAPQRIDQGSYGRCEVCGAAIAPERLDAVPYVTSCIKCSL